MSLELNNNDNEKKGLFAKIKSKIGTKEERRARSKKMSKKTKRIIAFALIICIAGAFGLNSFLKNKKGTDTPVNTAVATIGRVRSAISASGTIQPKDKYEVVASVRGDVLTDTFEVGDVIKKGDVLYEIDKEDMADTLEKAQMSMDRTRDSYNDTMDNIAELTVKAPISGVITNMYVGKGDSVSNGTKICDITDTSKMILTIPFNTSDIGYIGKGFMADVTLQNSFYKTTGVVTRVSTGSIVNDLNVAVSYVDIEVDNPGGITPSDTATAVINTIACNSAGTFEYANKKTVSAKVSGDVATVYNDLGDQVYSGSTILVMESETVEESVKNANRSLREAQISLENTYDQLDNYTITAKIDGTIIEKSIKAGDTLDNTNGNTTMCVIADMSVISFTINVDELDVDKIEIDQKVDITADALPNKRFEGHVNSININGTTSNGVTTYPVEVIVDNPDGMLPGMNVNAEIVIEEKNNVLVVPVSAVMRGNVVYVKEEDAKNLPALDPQTNKPSENNENKNQNNTGKPQSEDSQKGQQFNKEGMNGNYPNGANGNINREQMSGSQQKKPFNKEDFGGNYSGQSGNMNKEQMPDSKQNQQNKETKADDTGKQPVKEENETQKKQTETKQTETKQTDAEKTKANSQSNGNNKQNGGNMMFGNVPEGFVAVRVQTGISDDNFIEITGGLKEGVTVYVKAQSTTSTQNMMRMPGGMSGMGGMGGMNRMPSGMGGMGSGGARTQGSSQMRRN